MSLTYRTRRRFQRWGTVAMVVAIIFIVLWLISALWLQRYVIYSREGASVDLSRPISESDGVRAQKPQAAGSISIYYNEGSDAVELTTELYPVTGYYVSYDDLSKHMDEVWENFKLVKSGSTMMIELKGGYGTFYYSSKLAEATPSASVDTPQVDALIDECKAKGIYLIGRVSSLRDRMYGNSHVPSGLYMLSRAGLWMDPGGCYWLNPLDMSAQNWICAVANEVKGLGFNEVMLADFAFPNTDQYIFSEDKEASLLTCLDMIMKNVQTDYFTVSFGVATSAFPLPEGRSRIYIESTDAANAQRVYDQADFENKDARLVFLAATNDSRYASFSVLRPLSCAPEVEARKNEMAGN